MASPVPAAVVSVSIRAPLPSLISKTAPPSIVPVAVVLDDFDVAEQLRVGDVIGIGIVRL